MVETKYCLATVYRQTGSLLELVCCHIPPPGEVAPGENPLQLASKQCPRLGTRLRKSDPQFAKEKKLGIGNSGHTLPSLS